MSSAAKQLPLGFKLPRSAPSSGAAAIVEALSKQLACYQRLAKLAELQHEHVQRGQVEGLIDVLNKRGEVLSEVAILEQAVTPAKKDWATFLANLPAEKRASAESMLAETRRLLEQITTADKDDVLVLQQRKLSLGRQINQTTTARTVNRNYATSAYGKPAARMDVSS
jgi:hypothetical protein